MNPIKRGFLYLRRKKGRTIILLAVLSVLSILVFLCISVGNSANHALQVLRETMGGYFRISPDYENGSEQRIDDVLVEKIMDVDGIKAWNGLDTSYLLAENVILQPGRFSREGDYKSFLARFLSCSDSSLHEYFFLHSFSLVDGRHITSEDSGKALISQEVAELNDLSVGDTISARMDLSGAPEEVQGSISSHELEIVGIYKIDVPQVQGSDSAECDLAENFIFTDTSYIREVKEEQRESPVDFYSSGATFFVENPKEQGKVIATVLQIPGYNWEEFQLIQNNRNYENSAVPLERIAKLITAVVFTILIVGIVLVTLVLFLWMRDRVHEIGIFLSLGIRKSSILGQHLVENFLVAVIALFIAWGISTSISSPLEQLITGTVSVVAQNAADRQENGKQTENLLYPDPIESQQVDTAELVNVQIGMIELVEVSSLGGLLILLSTSISSGLVLRTKPREIFIRSS